MRRRPHAVWLLDSTDPLGANVMALRRIRALRRHVAGRALAMTAGSTRPPAGSPFAAVELATGVGGRLDLAGADLVVTTSGATLAWAARRVRPEQRLVHFVHVPLPAAVRDDRFVHHAWRTARVVVPSDVDAAAFAAALGLHPRRVVAADDFVLPGDSLLSTATGRVVLCAGRWTSGSGVAEVVEGFALAAGELPGWQLRLYGGGPDEAALTDAVERRRLQGRVLLMGQRHDLAAEYLDAGVVARLAAHDVAGLPVLEALAAGVPVLGAPTVPAVARHVVQGLNGLVLERTDPVAVAEALVSIADPARRAMLARGARATRAGLLTEVSARDLVALFRAALATEPQRTPLPGGARAQP